jgi:hypothetical protein
LVTALVARPVPLVSPSTLGGVSGREEVVKKLTAGVGIA